MLQTLLFFHVLAAIGLFTGITLELITVLRVSRAATLSEVRAATLNTPLMGPLMGLSSLLLIGMGIAMVYVGGFSWAAGWLNAVFVLTIVLAVLGPAVTGRKADAMHALALQAGDGPITQAVDNARRDRVFNYMVFMSLFELIAALYVMVTKPDLIPAVTVIAGAAVLAAFPAALLLRRSSAPALAET